MKCYLVYHKTPNGMRRHWESSRVKAKSWLVKHQREHGRTDKDGVLEIEVPAGKGEMLSWLNLNCTIGEEDVKEI